MDSRTWRDWVRPAIMPALVGSVVLWLAGVLWLVGLAAWAAVSWLHALAIS